MMEAAVTGGTGTAAQIPGIQVAGKTGTAETGVDGRQHDLVHLPSRPADHPRDRHRRRRSRTRRGFGGQVAAPIAKAVMEALLAGRSNPNL